MSPAIRRILPYIGIGLLCLLLLAAVLFMWATSGVKSPGIYDAEVIDTHIGDPPKAGASLKLMSWNIAFAHGRGSGGKGYEQRQSDDLMQRLRAIGDAMRESRADIILIQEIDFDAARTYHVDQLTKLMEITGLPYAARGVTWELGYLPWPSGNHFGAMNSGGAVLSRYPIKAHKLLLHEQPRANSWIYNTFYIFRHTQLVEIYWGNRVLSVFNSHLEAYDQTSREAQARVLAEFVVSSSGADSLVVVGGDMNTVKPNAGKRHYYEDEPGTDFRTDRTMQILDGIEGLREVVTDQMRTISPDRFYTFPARRPSRQLDYIYVNNGIAVSDVAVLQSGDYSDHLPIVATIRVE